MDTFYVSLEEWMKANPRSMPKHSIRVETTIGKFIEFCDYKFEDRDGDERTLPGVKIKSQVGPLIGSIYSAEIILPISFLREIEAIREDKINQILK
jgi:hypothetical protein